MISLFFVTVFFFSDTVGSLLFVTFFQTLLARPFSDSASSLFFRLCWLAVFAL